MARTRDEPSELEKDLPFSSPPGQMLIGLVVSGLGVAWLVNQINRSPQRSLHWAIVMIAGGGAMLAIGVRGLIRQLAIARQARRTLDQHPELEAELRQARQNKKSPGILLREKGYESVKLRRAILRRVDLT